LAAPARHSYRMRIALLIPALIALSACAATPVDTIQMDPRPIAQTQREVAFVSGLFNDIQGRSISENREYCGLIGVDSTGAYVASPARRGGVASCLPPSRSSVGFQVLASYHTHGSASLNYYTEIPSYDDMRTDIEDGTDGYIATPGGRLWYVDARARIARQLCGLDCLVDDPNHVEDQDYRVYQKYSLNQLRAF
jgi:hypothetical protein